MKVYFLSLKSETPCKDYWDYGIIYDLFKGIESEEVNSLPKLDFGVVVIPARSHAKEIEKINKQLSNLKSVVLFLMGDEESNFPVHLIKHENIKIWVQNARPEFHSWYRRIGTGYPPHIHDYYTQEVPSKTNDYFFAGQVTHKRRVQMCENLRGKPNGILIESEGFTQGIDKKDYVKQLSESKVAPCPSGPETPDTFRLFEALELGCVPIADNETPTEVWEGFWEWLFGEAVPFPTINNYRDLPGYIDDCVKQYPMLNNRVQAWYLRYKNKLRKLLYKDIEDLTGINYLSNISVVIPISFIPSHPDTEIIETTINSVLHHLPDSDIYLTFDGIREEQSEYINIYEESIRRTLWKYKNKNIIPFIFDEHKHQVGMFREIIDLVKTDTVLYVEQDTPLVTDYEIPFKKLTEVINSGESNLIRFHFEAHVPEEHNYLMIGEVESELLKTAQWSQRPHLASTAFYRRILSEVFSDKANCFIEDLVHGKVITDYKQYGLSGWNQWRLHIYHPEGNIKRSYHTDGRAGSIKYDDKQIW